VALAAVAGSWRVLGLPASYVLVGAGLYAGIAVLLAFTLPHGGTAPDGAGTGAPQSGIGTANRVTLARAALATPVFALTVWPGALGIRGAWLVIVLSTAVLLLDGLDGRVARRTGTVTAFGARFDMELDAALLMVLSVLVWRSGRVGAWVLLIGLMRYAFVAASWRWKALAAELPPSVRRKVVCVVQGVALLVALGPIIPVWGAVGASAAGLAALTWSFGVDVRWALRHGG
jgi:phosphatidylglycerophosphate synthase